MQGNSNFERNVRTNRNARPPRGNELPQRQQPQQRGKTWTRDSDKRERSDFFNMLQ